MRSSSCLWLASMNTCLLPSSFQLGLGTNRERIWAKLFIDWRVPYFNFRTTFKMRLYLVCNQPVWVLTAVGVNCFSAISQRHDDLLKCNSRSISCLPRKASLIHAAAVFHLNVGPAGAENFMMCYSAHRFFPFSISACGWNAAIRQERVGEMPVSGFTVYGHNNLSWHPSLMVFGTHASCFFLLYPSL